MSERHTPSSAKPTKNSASKPPMQPEGAYSHGSASAGGCFGSQGKRLKPINVRALKENMRRLRQQQLETIDRVEELEERVHKKEVKKEKGRPTPKQEERLHAEVIHSDMRYIPSQHYY